MLSVQKHEKAGKWARVYIRTHMVEVDLLFYLLLQLMPVQL